MTLLGIDYGQKNIGIAVTDGVYAQPLGSGGLLNNKLIFQNIASLCEKHQVEKIVIGETEQIKSFKNFVKKLSYATNRPVIKWDETLSTSRAQKQLIVSGLKQKRRKRKEHNVAAAVLLQDYLEYGQNT